MDIKINFEPYSDIDSDSQCEENQEEEIYYQDNQFEFPFFQLNHTQHVADADDDDDYLDDMDSQGVALSFDFDRRMRTLISNLIRSEHMNIKIKVNYHYDMERNQFYQVCISSTNKAYGLNVIFHDTSKTWTRNQINEYGSYLTIFHHPQCIEKSLSDISTQTDTCRAISIHFNNKNQIKHEISHLGDVSFIIADQLSWNPYNHLRILQKGIDISEDQIIWSRWNKNEEQEKDASCLLNRLKWLIKEEPCMKTLVHVNKSLNDWVFRNMYIH